MTKEVEGLQNYLQQISRNEINVLKKEEKIQQRPETWPESCIWPCIFSNRDKRLIYAKLHTSWTETHGQQVIWSEFKHLIIFQRWPQTCSKNVSRQNSKQWNAVSHALASPQPGPHHYWTSVGSFWQRTEPKGSQSQRRAFSVFREAWRAIPENYLKKAYVREFRMCWRTKMDTFDLILVLYKPFFALYTIFLSKVAILHLLPYSRPAFHLNVITSDKMFHIHEACLELWD